MSAFEYHGYTVGHKVKVVVEFPPCGGNGLQHTKDTFVGIVEMPHRDDPEYTIRITTGIKGFKERIIPVERVTNRRRILKKAFLDKKWKVKSNTSAKVTYDVRRHKGMWTCNCQGYTFRGFCTHIKEKQKKEA